MILFAKNDLIILLQRLAILVLGGDLVSTGITKLEVHVEDVTTLVKNVAKLIVANTKRNSAVNDNVYALANNVDRLAA